MHAVETKYAFCIYCKRLQLQTTSIDKFIILKTNERKKRRIFSNDEQVMTSGGKLVNLNFGKSKTFFECISYDGCWCVNIIRMMNEREREWDTVVYSDLIYFRLIFSRSQLVSVDETYSKSCSYEFYRMYIQNVREREWKVFTSNHCEVQLIHFSIFFCFVLFIGRLFKIKFLAHGTRLHWVSSFGKYYETIFVRVCNIV